MRCFCVSPALLLWLAAVVSAAPAPAPHRSLRLPLLLLERYMGFTYACEEGRKAEVMQAAFDDALGRLADSVDADEFARCVRREGTDLRAKLVVIACDRKKRLELYRTMDKRYHQVVRSDQQITFPHPPWPDDTVEANRLVWEYLLLRPTPNLSPAFHARTALEALGRIGNEASLPAYLFTFRNLWLAIEAGCKWKQVEPRLIDTHLEIERFRSPRGLRAMLECAAWFQPRVSNLRERDRSAWMDPVGCVRRCLHGDYKALWMHVLGDFPRDELPKEQRRILDEALNR